MENIDYDETESSHAGICDVLSDTYTWVFITEPGRCQFSIWILANENHPVIRY